MDKSLKLVAVMGKEAFMEWRSRAPIHRPEEGIDNMLVLLDAVGEEEFRQMAHQKYLDGLTTALELRSRTPRAKKTVNHRGGVERRATRLPVVQSFQDRPVEPIPRRVLKEEQGAGRLESLTPAPQLRASTVTKKPWSNAEKAALSKWLEEDERDSTGIKRMGAPSVAARAKEALAEELAGRSVLSISIVIRQIRSVRGDGNRSEARSEVGGVVGVRKQTGRAKKSTGGDGEPVPCPVRQRPPTPARPNARTHSQPSSAVNNPNTLDRIPFTHIDTHIVTQVKDPWSTGQQLALTNWFDTILANTRTGETIVLKHLAVRAQIELAEELPGRSVRAIESKLLKLRRGVIKPAKLNVGEKGVHWSPMQKALLVRWIEQNAAGEMAMNSSTSIPLAQRAKDDLGDEFHDRSVMTVANAILKIKSFATKAMCDEWVKKDGL